VNVTRPSILQNNKEQHTSEMAMTQKAFKFRIQNLNKRRKMQRKESTDP
jgi:hypothetical protein